MNVQSGRPVSAGKKDVPSRRWMPSRRALRFRLHVTLLALDVACVIAAFLLALVLYPEPSEHHWLTTASAVLPLYLASAFLNGAYSVQVLQNRALGVSRALYSFSLAAGAVIFVAFYLKASTAFSRVTFAAGFVGGLSLLSLGRWIFLNRAERLLGGNPFNVVLIAEDGSVPPPGEFSTVLAASSFDPDDADSATMYDRLAKALSQADRVVVACKTENRVAWAHILQGANVEAEILVPELASLTPMGVARFGETPTVVVAKGPLNVSDRVVKRTFDIAVAGTALLVCAPLLVLVGLAILIESRGGVFFVQTRIGRANRHFRMLKFRSMRVEMADHRADRLVERGDRRISRVGALLRRTSIDELPQLLNVLKGDMSIVGPRPHALGARAADKLYWEVDSRYWHRHAAKPGLTGLAQIRGYRGNTERELDLTNRLQADLEYLSGWTIWRDLRIIVLTARVLMHKNAY